MLGEVGGTLDSHTPPSSYSIVPFRSANCSRKAEESRTFSWTTPAARIDAPRQKSPTRANPAHASISPPMIDPPNAPRWVVILNNPIAVVRECPASSSTNVGVTAEEILARLPAPQASATVAHGDPHGLKTIAAKSPLPQQ